MRKNRKKRGLFKKLWGKINPPEKLGAKIYVVFSDIHVPYHDSNVHKAACDLLTDLRPDGLVINGDFLDLIEVSSHSAGSVAQLEGRRVANTFKVANRVLDEYQAAAGEGCNERFFIDGNHEDRLRRWMESGDNAVWLDDPSTSIQERLKLADRGFVYKQGYPKAYIRLGHLIVTHGRWCGRNAASIHLERYGHSVLVGHVHTPGMHHGSSFEKQRAGFVQGHMADPDSPALSYAPAPNSWVQGFSVVYVEPNGNFHVDLVRFVDGAFFYNRKRYGRKR